jgi:hypothetical protein
MTQSGQVCWSLSACESDCDVRNTTSRRSERDRLPIAVRGHVQKRRESLPFNSRVDTIAFDAAEELPGDMVGFFEPTTCPFRKFHPAQIRIVRQNHRIIESDAYNAARARNARRGSIQVANPA